MRLARSLFLLSIGVAGVFSLASAKNNPDSFAGKWILDKHAPRPGDAPDHLETKIKQNGAGITIESTFAEPRDGVVPLLYLGVMAEKLHLSTDGQEQQQQIGPFMAAFKTNMDGERTLKTDWAAQIRGDQVQGHWVHTLSDDGKHMTLKIEESSTHGQHAEATLEFVRK